MFGLHIWTPPKNTTTWTCSHLFNWIPLPNPVNKQTGLKTLHSRKLRMRAVTSIRLLQAVIFFGIFLLIASWTFFTLKGGGGVLLGVISQMAIQSILVKDKYLQFLCVPLTYHLADLGKSTKW